jgi:hypothetical protein
MLGQRRCYFELEHNGSDRADSWLDEEDDSSAEDSSPLLNIGDIVDLDAPEVEDCLSDVVEKRQMWAKWERVALKRQAGCSCSSRAIRLAVYYRISLIITIIDCKKRAGAYQDSGHQEQVKNG